MRRFLTLVTLALSCLSLQADIILDEVMSPDEQKRTGVSSLTAKQKIALEAWLNQNFVTKAQAAVPAAPQLSLSINIDNGQKLVLSDNSVWEIAPSDVPTASVWITPFPVKIAPSNDPNYPSLIINTDSGVSVKARRPATNNPAPTSPAIPK